MKFRRMLATLSITLFLLPAAVMAGTYPEAMEKQILAMKADAEQKKDMPATIEGVKNVTTEDAHRLFKEKKAVFLDNRVKSQFDTEKIQGAEWLFCDDLLKDPKTAAKLDKGKTYIAYCNGTHCWRSPAVALMLGQEGFPNVLWYRDGLPDWKKKGYPTE